MKALSIIMVFCVAGVVNAQWHINTLWDRSGRVDSARYGIGIIPLGDQNHDGYADWAVAAFGPWRNDEIGSVSYTEFFHGGNPPSSIPYRVFNPDSTMWDVYVTSAGDVNGDSYQDWLTWTRYRGDPQTYVIRLYFGGSSADTLPQAVLHLTTNEDLYDMGDFNGDGFDDLYRYDQDTDQGWVYFGNTPFDTLPDWHLVSPPDMPYLADFESSGDLNGDHLADFIPWNNTNGLNIFWGSMHPDSTPGTVIPGIGGSTKRVVRDLNRDGRDELVIPFLSQVQVYLCGDSIVSVPNVTLQNAGCEYTPHHLNSAGDINRDGYNDLLVSDWDCNNGWGKLTLYLGNYELSPNPVLVIDGRTAPLNLIGIWTVVGLGDVNGDSIGDFAIGAWNYDADGVRGRVVILSGDTTVRVEAGSARAPLPNRLDMSVYPNPLNSIAVLSYSLPREAEVELGVYDVTGRRMTLQAQGRQGVGTHEIRLDVSGWASGVYFVRVRAGTESRVEKVMLLR